MTGETFVITRLEFLAITFSVLAFFVSFWTLLVFRKCRRCHRFYTCDDAGVFKMRCACGRKETDIKLN
jgi:hypothetical protein